MSPSAMLGNVSRATALVLGAMSLLSGGLCWGATLSTPIPLRTAVTRADLIIVGTVTNITFRDSQGDGKATLQAPHTFVTYSIDDVLRGSTDKNSITLRFIGGYSPATGRVMLAPDWPLFQVGDRDALLIRGNGAYFCPLVGCGLGRFRIVDGRAYTNTGLAVRIDAGGAMTVGPDGLDPGRIAMVVPPAPQARVDELRRRLANDTSLDAAARTELASRLRAMSSPRTLGIARLGAPQGPIPTTPPVAAETLISYLRSLADGAPPPTGYVPSLSPDKPFSVPAPAPQRPKHTGRPAVPRQLTLEQRLLRQNGGNPVLKPAPQGNPK